MGRTRIEMPVIDVNEEKATVTEILFGEGEQVNKGDIIISVENTKASSDITAPIDGYILPICKPFDEIPGGEVIAYIFDTQEELAEYKNKELSTDNKNEGKNINATKKAITLAEQMGIDINKIASEKQDGVIKEKDVLEYAKVNSIQLETSKPSFTLKRERVVIIGAGKGAEVVIDILLDDPSKVIVGLVDDNVRELRNYSFPVLDCTVNDFPDKYGAEFYDTAIISIGANRRSMRVRSAIFLDYEKRGVKFTNAISKSAEIRRGVQLGVGNIVGAGCYIGTLTIIGNNNCINYGTNIGHHNVVGSHNLFAPGVFTSGSDTIGDSCILPAGVAMVNRAQIGNNVVVPVGYAISGNVDSDVVIKNRV